METWSRLGLVLMLAVLPLLGMGCSTEPKNIQVTVEAPSQVKNQQKFAILVHIENSANAPQTIVDLDIAEDFLKGIAIEKTEPVFKEASHIPIDNTMSYNFNMAIPANGDVTVTFWARAVHPGDYPGHIDICVNSAISFLTEPLRTVVE
ncbi:MAG TPA: hypothetical protein VJ873_04420 [bacterium]|nr:hypothetical protein [bacterium]